MSDRMLACGKDFIEGRVLSNPRSHGNGVSTVFDVVYIVAQDVSKLELCRWLDERGASLGLSLADADRFFVACKDTATGVVHVRPLGTAEGEYVFGGNYVTKIAPWVAGYEKFVFGIPYPIAIYDQKMLD